MSAPVVDILLSTYNGAKHLDAQLASLQSQSHASWRLLIRDDGSTDTTEAIIAAWARKEDRLTLVREPAGNLGARNGFFALLTQSDAPFFMFCDQDDIWLPGKIAETLALLRGAPRERPAAAFTDVRVVDEQGGAMADSFIRSQGIDLRAALEWPRLLTQNVVSGCTLMGNAALREKALIPSAEMRDAALMHDGWLALIAQSMGTLIFLDRPTALYRQHAGNALGAKGGGLARYLANLRRGEGLDKAMRYFRRVSRQAAAFRRCYGGELDAVQREALDVLANACDDQGRVRLVDCLRCWAAGARMTSWDQDLAVALSVLFWGRRKDMPKSGKETA